MTREFTLPQNYTSENDSAESSLKSRAVKLLSTIISLKKKGRGRDCNTKHAWHKRKKYRHKTEKTNIDQNTWK